MHHHDAADMGAGSQGSRGGFAIALCQEDVRQPKCLQAFVENHWKTIQRLLPGMARMLTLKHHSGDDTSLEMTTAENKDW